MGNVWGPMEGNFQINPKKAAYDNQLKSANNTMMYSLVAKKNNIALITGHTHQPVFASLTHLERIYVQLKEAKKNKAIADVSRYNAELKKRIRKGDKAPEFSRYKANYFNSGCCCFSDGDITGIEIQAGQIRLIKWSSQKSSKPERIVLEELQLKDLIDT